MTQTPQSDEMQDSASSRIEGGNDALEFIKECSPHIAIIMDGNGRWAKERRLPRTLGHKAGVDAVRRTIRGALDLGIGHLTLFSFSSENWSRPRAEVEALLALLRRYIRSDLADLNANNVRIRVIGRRDNLPKDILAHIEDAERLTSNNTALKLTIAFNYGGRDEIVRSVRKVAQRVASGSLSPDEISELDIESNLDTASLPMPDLVIRTSGEARVSNFLLWQIAYAEFLFVDSFWPDFGPEHLKDALECYASRDRRFGGLTQKTGTI